MGKLIGELTNEHQLLVKALTDLKSLDVNSADGQNILKTAKGALVQHLEKEDKHLYPSLKSYAEEDASFKGTLSVMMSNMETLTEETLAFFGKYIGKENNKIDFAKDLAELTVKLSMRIRREEGTLYPQFDKIAS